MRKLLNIITLSLFLYSCQASKAGPFGRGVSISFDPRTVGMQIDDTLMQKNLVARLTLTDKKYFLGTQIEVLDGRIFITGKVDEPEEKLKITKLAWETKGVRSVNNAIEIRGKKNFKSSAQDVLITTQLRTAMIFNKKIKSSNYTLETINKKIYIFGISFNEDEKKEVIKEAEEVYNSEKVIPTIFLVSELSRSKI
ncbi:MAG: phospholipid-binding protein [Pelagibacterales bacterium MED-G40]|nr:MAG: phospholipid-binding protein [Candidatus Pelagibacter sp. TMED203]PDH20242.1 MAG: phospholipid-binding protein [Pelagibacterales bacterium MED-G40]|tara:strand:- start:8863 stop:9450 length:588 start_codon:yes stop_codon:yes gene_type:complete